MPYDLLVERRSSESKVNTICSWWDADCCVCQQNVYVLSVRLVIGIVRIDWNWHHPQRSAEQREEGKRNSIESDKETQQKKYHWKWEENKRAEQTVSDRALNPAVQIDQSTRFTARSFMWKMEESIIDFVRPIFYDRPTGLRVRKWLCPTKFWERSVGRKIFTLTPTRPFSHERTCREPRRSKNDQSKTSAFRTTKLTNPVSLPYAGASHPTIRRPVGKMFFSMKISASDRSTPTVGKQPQIIFFRVITGRSDSGLCLRLTNEASNPHFKPTESFRLTLEPSLCQIHDMSSTPMYLHPTPS